MIDDVKLCFSPRHLNALYFQKIRKEHTKNEKCEVSVCYYEGVHASEGDENPKFPSDEDKVAGPQLEVDEEEKRRTQCGAAPQCSGDTTENLLFARYATHAEQHLSVVVIPQKTVCTLRQLGNNKQSALNTRTRRR